MDSQGHDIRYALEKLKESPERIRFCIVTHWHNDHSSGADYIEKFCKRPIYCHPFEGEKLTAPVTNSVYNRLSALIPEAGPLILLKGLLKDGPAISLTKTHPVRNGEVLAHRFHIIETPGHTPGHIAIWDSQTKILFAGDALAVVRKRLTRMARVVTEDLEAGVQSMLKALSFDTDIVCPGHREPLHDAKTEINRFREDISKNQGAWPLFG
jgi:glyoxylase-like metal-dependent hydrolase (beta-lactamase superfamily II)